MPSLDKPCFLLPHGSERSNVYVCIPVDTGLATKSPVLETLMEFDGLVEMPEGISLDDFEAWAAIATQDPSQLALEELSLGLKVCTHLFDTTEAACDEMSEIPRLLQVSDQLSAHNSTQLAAAFAAKLKATDWSSTASKEAAVHALLRLGKNVQHLVFREAGNLSAPTIFSWPMLLQQVRRSPCRSTDTFSTLTIPSESYYFPSVAQPGLHPSNTMIAVFDTHTRMRQAMRIHAS